MRQLPIIVASLLLASPCAAQKAGPSLSPQSPPATQPPSATIMAEPVAVMMGACDANNDAQVTRPELTACVARSFVMFDTANRGMVGYIVFADWAERWLGDRNALPSPFEVDSSGDNQITLAELQTQFSKTFDRFDRDKNETLVRAELLTLDISRGIGGGRDRPSRRGEPRAP